jgi:hypothetical protein
MSWLRDMAYIAIGWLVAIMLWSIVFLCTMSAVSYARCTQIVDVGQGVRSAIPCVYDPNPLGIAIAACLGAFGSPIGALALYMGQTRRNPQPPKQTPTPTVTTTTTTQVDAPTNPLRKPPHGAMG